MTEKKLATTPVGRLSYPRIAEKHSYDGKQEPEYSCSLYIAREDMSAAKALIELTLEIYNAKSKTKANKFSDIPKTPLTSIRSKKEQYERDNQKEYKIPNGITLDHYIVRAHTQYDFPVVGPTKEILDPAEVLKIKAGDWARLVVNPVYYPQQGGGVTYYLTTLQFKQPGESFGTGDKAALDMLDELQVNLDDLAEEPEESPLTLENIEDAIP
jgi:hypothetical protein